MFEPMKYLYRRLKPGCGFSESCLLPLWE